MLPNESVFNIFVLISLYLIYAMGVIGYENPSG